MSDPDGFEKPYVLKNSKMDGFPAKSSSVADRNHLEARFYCEDLLMTTQSIPQGHIEITGNISPGTQKQQGVGVKIDSSEFGSLINLMMLANAKRTLAAIGKALGHCSEKWPERHWDVLD